MGARPDSRFSKPSVHPCGRDPDFGARDPDGGAGAERFQSCRKRDADRGRGSAGGPCSADLRRACRRTGLWVLGRAHRAGAGGGASVERHGAGCQSAREAHFRGRRSRGFQRCAEVRACGVRRRVRAGCRRRILRSGGVHGSVRHTGLVGGCGIGASRCEPVGAGMIPRGFDLTLAGTAGAGASGADCDAGAFFRRASAATAGNLVGTGFGSGAIRLKDDLAAAGYRAGGEAGVFRGACVEGRDGESSPSLAGGAGEAVN